MAQLSVVNKSELEGAIRLDAEYYMPKYRNAMNAVHKYGSFCELSKIGKVLRGKNPTAYSDGGIPVIRAIDLRDITKTEDFLCADPKEALFLLKQGDILISSIGEGSIGKVQIFQDTMKCATVSEVSVIRVTSYNPHAVATFLKTSYGYLQLEQRITGSTGQLHLYPKDIATVIVPLVPASTQKAIEEIDIESDHEFRRSKALYLQAEQVLLDEIGFKNLDLSHQLCYTVPYGKVREVGRLDAEHFQPNYELLIEYLAKTGKTDLLSNRVTQPIRRGLQPTYVEDGEVIVVNSRHLGRYFLNIDATERTDEIFWKNNKPCQLRRNDVLFYSTGAYIGRTNAWLEDQKAITSNHVTIIRPDHTCNPLYLAAYLNSPLGLLQADCWASGSGQREVYPNDIGRFVVYLPSMEFQQRIADLVTQSWEARQKARQLLEEAKRKVEDLIEGKGDKGGGLVNKSLKE